MLRRVMPSSQLVLGVAALMFALIVVFVLIHIRKLAGKQDLALKLLRQSVKATKRNNELLERTNTLLETLSQR